MVFFVRYRSVYNVFIVSFCKAIYYFFFNNIIKIGLVRFIQGGWLASLFIIFVIYIALSDKTVILC